MYRSTLLVCCFFIAACAQFRWEKVGATQQEFIVDQNQCLQSSTVIIPPKPYIEPQGKMVSGIYVSPSKAEYLAATLAAQGSTYTNQEMYESCLMAKGYTKVKVKK